MEYESVWKPTVRFMNKEPSSKARQSQICSRNELRVQYYTVVQLNFKSFLVSLKEQSHKIGSGHA
jgi:hypothetical protein